VSIRQPKCGTYSGCGCCCGRPDSGRRAADSYLLLRAYALIG